MQGEYRGDFTRDTFCPAKHFSRVLMQQGRVQLDADWNEQVAILLRYQRLLAADLIGPHGGPDEFGFAIGEVIPGEEDFEIAPGHYYVDGVLCELESTPVVISVPDAANRTVYLATLVRDGIQLSEGQYVTLENGNNRQVTSIAKMLPESGGLVVADNLSPAITKPGTTLRRQATYLTQPNYPAPAIPDNAAKYLVYLDVWERHIVANQDQSISEVALGGVDTASRSKVIWQARISNKPPGNKLDDDAWLAYVAANLQPANRGLLKARVRPEPASMDPCVIAPASRYRGPENQLYRVEIQTGGEAWDGKMNQAGQPEGAASAATFKWSRENGSVTFPVLTLTKGINTTTATLAHLGRDPHLSLAEGDWVEIVDDDYALSEPGRVDPAPLLRVTAVDRVNLQVVLEKSPPGSVGSDPKKHPMLRRWDHKQGESGQGGLTLKDGSALVESRSDGNPWLNLEDGIQIQFQPRPAATCRAGDYWLIPARVATGDIEWPSLRNAQGEPATDPATGQPIVEALPPHGVEHHYAPLGLITVDAGGKVTATNAIFRRTFHTRAT